jgi:hypothetical protein
VAVVIERALTAADKSLVCPVLISQLRSITLAWFLSLASFSMLLMYSYEFDGHLLIIEQVRAFKDDTERALADLPATNISLAL